MSAAVSTHTGAGPLSLMSCVRESSPPQDAGPDCENDKNAGTKKKFWNPRKWFKRKNHKATEDVTTPNEVQAVEPKESLRSRSTSELSVAEEQTRRRSGTPMHPGLSVSHDSVFHSPHSSSELELEAAQSSSSLSIHHQPLQPDLRLQTELTERLRLRRGRGDTSEDDEGLPRSPCNSPTTTEGLLDKTAIKDHPTKSHSTCSEGSLLSMGSSEMDDDSFGQYSSHSSKVSLQEKKSTDPESDLELGVTAPLNHSAAHHRVSVRPKRTHGAPRRKRVQQLSAALPTTPEVNEDSSIRSLTPESSSVRETLTELYSSKSMSKTRVRTMTESQLKCSSLPPGLAAPGSEGSKLSRSRSNAGSNSQDGFSALGEEDEDREDKKSDSFLGRLFPRRSGKKKKSKEEKFKEERITSSTVTNIISSSKHDEICNINTNIKSIYKSQQVEKRTVSVDTSLSARPHALIRSGPAARQRIQPNDIPASPELGSRSDENIILPKPSPEKHVHTSPLQIELENHFRQRLASSLSTSPSKVIMPPVSSGTPPLSPKSPRSPILSLSPPRSPVLVSKSPPKAALTDKQHFTKFASVKHSETKEIRTDETKSKVKIAGLSPFQQRALSHSDEVDEGFKSLTDLPSDVPKASKPVTKSHSFKSAKTYETKAENRYTFTSVSDQKSISSVPKETTLDGKSESKVEITKAASLDSIKTLETGLTDGKTEVKYKIKESEEPTIHLSDNKDILNEFIGDGITISGPSHKAIVSVGNSQSVATDVVSAQTAAKNVDQEVTQNEMSKETTIKEQQISVTKIQVKRESIQVMVSKNAVPEFFNVHLHKVEKPTNNVVLTAGLTSPKIIDEQSKPKTPTATDIESPLSEALRKFSKEDIEIVEKEKAEEQESPKHVATALVTITTMTPPVSSRVFKKSSDSSQHRKSSLVSVNSDVSSREKPVLKTKSSSLDMVESMKCDINEVDRSHSKAEEKTELKSKTQSASDIQDIVSSEGVSLRRKSIIKQKQEDEPELMKVFARRSLKLKDSESEQLSQQVILMTEESSNDNMSKSRDSDKENNVDSPLEERRKLSKEMPKSKEPLIETKFVETTEVTLRKPANNKIFAYQRTVSLNSPKTNEINSDKVHKQNSFVERPKTDHWFKVQDIDLGKKISQDDILTSISEKSDFINEEFSSKPKNFNQRKAEWEKRAQEALKKTVP